MSEREELLKDEGIGVRPSIGELLKHEDIPQPGDPSTKLYSNDYEEKDPYKMSPKELRKKGY